MTKARRIKPGKPKTKRLTSLVRGKYQHYKGKVYKVLGIARHSETLKELVIYQAQYGRKKLWARPKKMFFEKVKVGGKKVPRFKYLGK